MPIADRGLIFNHRWNDDLSESQIRAWVLFWDELVAINPPSQWDALPWGGTLLQSEGILSRLPLGTSVNDAILATKSEPLLTAFRDLEKDAPGKWSVASPKDEAELYSNSGRSILVRLYDVLPVPTRSVALEDVLSFRTRRRDEQLALRFHIESIYDRIVRSPDRAISIDLEMSALSSSMADAVTVLEEARMPFQFSALEAKLSWPLDVTPAAIGAAVGAMVSLPTAIVGGSIGLLANLIPKVEISSSLGLPPARANAHVPFAYVVHMDQDL